MAISLPALTHSVRCFTTRSSAFFQLTAPLLPLAAPCSGPRNRSGSYRPRMGRLALCAGPSPVHRVFRIPVDLDGPPFARLDQDTAGLGASRTGRRIQVGDPRRDLFGFPGVRNDLALVLVRVCSRMRRTPPRRPGARGIVSGTSPKARRARTARSRPPGTHRFVDPSLPVVPGWLWSLGMGLSVL